MHVYSFKIQRDHSFNCRKISYIYRQFSNARRTIGEWDWSIKFTLASNLVNGRNDGNNGYDEQDTDSLNHKHCYIFIIRSTPADKHQKKFVSKFINQIQLELEFCFGASHLMLYVSLRKVWDFVYMWMIFDVEFFEDGINRKSNICVNTVVGAKFIFVRCSLTRCCGNRCSRARS